MASVAAQRRKAEIKRKLVAYSKGMNDRIIDLTETVTGRWWSVQVGTGESQSYSVLKGSE